MINRIELGEYWVNDFTLESLMDTIETSVHDNKKVVIANHNLHSIYYSTRRPKMKQFFDEADYIHVDGMPIILLGKAIGANLSGANRLTYLDWIDDIFSLASKNQWRVFYLGSKQEVTDMVVDKMQRDYPNVAMSGASGSAGKPS